MTIPPSAVLRTRRGSICVLSPAPASRKDDVAKARLGDLKIYTFGESAEAPMP
jgi:hypothetical protein